MHHAIVTTNHCLRRDFFCYRHIKQNAGLYYFRGYMSIKGTRPVVLANAQRVDFRSRINGRRYSLSVALPLVQVSGRASPVFYVLDGHWYFASAVEAVRANAPGVIVVGVSYPDDEAYVESVLARHRPLPVWLEAQRAKAVAALEREYDLSLPATDESLASNCVPGYVPTSKDVGGLDDFLRVLEAEVKPRVGALISVDDTNQVIFGHSLGGLAVIHALFVGPNAYRTFIASSPVIWWSEKAVLTGEAKFAEAVCTRKAAPRVLITMGGEEDDPEIAARFDLDVSRYAALVRKHRMIENARELIQRLRVLRGSDGYLVGDYALFPRQDHIASPWPALGRAVAFAFPHARQIWSGSNPDDTTNVYSTSHRTSLSEDTKTSISSIDQR
jgi:predicted alpha/beta superfamily hydrolase